MYIKAIVLTMIIFLNLSFYDVSIADSSLSAQQQEMIKKVVRSELQKLINEEGFLDQSIERSVEIYIAKQREKSRQQKLNSRSRQAINIRPVSLTDDHIYGDPNAPISLVEYSDFECPFCKSFHSTVKKLVAQNQGKVNWVYRHFPLDFHNPGAQKQAEASECAAEQGGNDAFWKFTDLIYARTRSNGKGFPISALVPLAEEIGLKADLFKTCLDSNRMAEKVAKDHQNGISSGISGTPGSIFINHSTKGVKASAGALPLGKLQTIIDKMLAQ